MKLYEYLNSFAKDKCSEYVFGVPGSYIMPIWQNLDSFKVVLCTNEADAGYIASGYCRDTLKPVIVLTTASPGVTNCISGMASAFKDSLPLIFISGTIPQSKKGNGCFQEESGIGRDFSTLEVTKSITKKNYLVEDADDFPEVLFDAYHTATTGRKGCVHLSIPVDVQNQNINREIPAQEPPAIISENETIIPRELVNAITNHENMLIIVGWGVHLSDADCALDDFCKNTKIPVVATMKGLYSVNMSRNCFLGKLGLGYSKETEDYIRCYKPKHVIALGTSFGSKDFSFSLWKALEEATVWSFNIENTKSSCLNDSYHFVGTHDLNTVINELTEICADYDCNACCKFPRKHFDIGDDELMAKTINAINDYSGKNYLITADAGNHYLSALNLYLSNGINEFWIDAGLAAMGNGICGTIGMAFAKRHKRFICVTGDGCVLMNGNSMHLAKEHELPIIFIVYSNSSLGRVRIGQFASNKFISSDISTVDFVEYGKSFGMQSKRVENYNEFISVLDEFVKYGEPCLIEVITDKNEIPKGL